MYVNVEGSLERRKFVRSKSEDCLAFLENYPCEIIDISKGGVALRYVNTEEWNGYSSVDLACPRKLVVVPRIPARKVFDEMVEEMAAGSSFQVRRCGLEFYGLNAEQEEKLLQFIQVAAK
jgi:c-di-GMP-binding flagellar brake protein YcgR